MADNAQTCLNKLCDELLGKDYYIASPVGGAQANEIITDDIIRLYKKRTQKGMCGYIRKIITSIAPLVIYSR